MVIGFMAIPVIAYLAAKKYLVPMLDATTQQQENDYITNNDGQKYLIICRKTFSIINNVRCFLLAKVMVIYRKGQQAVLIIRNTLHI